MSSDALAIVCVVAGVLIILGRGPLIFTPERTLELYRRMVGTEAAVRIVGLCVGALGAGMAVLARGGGGTGVSIVFVLGLVLAAAGLMLLVLPSPYRRVADSVLDFARDSVDPTVIRALGLVAAGIGAYLVYFGARLL